MAIVEPENWNSPSHVRYLLSHKLAGASYLGTAMQAVPAQERDTWWDQVLHGSTATETIIPDDSRDLPRGCAPYLPCPVDSVLVAIGNLMLQPDDVLIEIGAGIGRSAALAHFLTGAAVLSIEIQAELAETARRIARKLNSPRLTSVVADANEMIKYLPVGTAYLLYCPFGGERLTMLLKELERHASDRRIRISCIDMPGLDAPWLRPIGQSNHSVQTYESI